MTPNRPQRWVYGDDYLEYYEPDESDAIFERQEAEIARLVEALKKSRCLSSIGYHIGEADMRGHEKIGERWGKKQDDILAEIAAILAKYSAASPVTIAAPPDTSNGGER